MSRALLITGATGKQGGAVIDALIARQPSDDLLLAVTRNAQSASAQRLAAKSPRIKLVEGNLDAAPALFEAAKKAAGAAPLWGVFSVQASFDSGAALEAEVRQGKALVDEAIKAGVQHFVYSSVERGGDEKSWSDPTAVPHFRTKHEIELHLRDATQAAADGGKSAMGWTILRPVAFMENLAPGFQGKVFLTMLRDTMRDRPVQWVATRDIGFFAAEAFHDPGAWNHKALGLAGDELTFAQLSEAFEKATGHPAPTTFGLLGTALKYAMSELRIMVEWFRDEGYKADLSKVRELHPTAATMEAWLRDSAFAKGK